MDDIWVRLIAVVLLAGVALGASWALQRRSSRPVKVPNSVALPTGLYLFSSESCADCSTARATLDGRVGRAGYREISWESDPGIFSQIGVDAVPATLVVADDGRATLYPGQPIGALDSFSP